MKLIKSFSHFINESDFHQNAMEFWFVVSEYKIVAVYGNMKDAKNYYEAEIEFKKDLYFDKYHEEQEESGRRMIDYGRYSHLDGGYMDPPESTVSDEEYEEYFDDNYGNEIYLSGPYNLNKLPNDIQSLMTPKIMEDIIEHGVYEV
jgi:hypothetical protein